MVNTLPRYCLREPIPEIEVVAQIMSDAADAHLSGDRERARELFERADDPAVREWLESVWGKSSPWNTPIREVEHPAVVSGEFRARPRDPTAKGQRAVHLRDGWYCRHCHVPVIRSHVRNVMHREYPRSIPWGRSNATQHAGFQTLWAQYDHVVPWARGGTADFENIYLTCAACNYGRQHYLLEHFDLEHPAARPRREGGWDGLQRLLRSSRNDPVGPGSTAAT